MGDISNWTSPIIGDPAKRRKKPKKVAPKSIPEKPPSVKELAASGEYKKYNKGGKV
jgi:hypothetical protein